MKIKKYLLVVISLSVLLSSCVTVETESTLTSELESRFRTFNESENIYGWDMAHFYAAVGTKEEMLLAIELSDSLEFRDFLGNTPIMIAQRYNNLQSYEALLSTGCSINWLNLFSMDNSKIAHDIAFSYGYIIENNIHSKRKYIPDVSPTNLLPPDLEYNYFEDIEKYSFKPFITDFSLINCWFLSECSFLSYASPFFSQLVFNKAGYENFHFIDQDDNECMVVWNDDSIIISFRGTEQNSSSTRSDVLTDIKFLQTTYDKGGLVHRGFLEAFNTIWNGPDGLETFINELKSDGKNRAIWITGHSLGGALADICFTQMEDATGVYTFGAPRVGDKGFLDLTIGRPRWRVEHNQDPVTTVPKSIFSFDKYYYNMGDLIYIGKYGQVVDLSNTKYSELGLNYTEHFIEQDFLKVPDHMPINYSVKLWNYIPK